MQLFPPDDDLQFLLGKEVSNIVFGSSGVHFVWWEGGEIHAMRNFDHLDGEGVRHRFGEGMWIDPPSLLHRLVQRRVKTLDVDDQSLTLSFDDGQKLIFHAYTGRGENGLIQFGEDLKDGWIVW